MAKIKINKRLSLATHRRIVVLFVILCLLGLFVVGSVLSYFSLKHSLSSSYPADLKQQQVTELDIYEQGYASAVASYFSNTLNTITSLASDPGIMQAITSGQVNSLTTTFEHQRDFDQQFNTIAAYSASGSMLALSTDAPSLLQSPSVTLAQANPLVLAAARKHAPTITSAYKSAAGRYVLAFVAPVTDVNNKYVGVIVGTTTLSDLAARVNFLSSYPAFTNVITDVKGNILVKNNKAVTTDTDIAASDPVIHELQTHNNTQTLTETNYAGQAVVAEGKVISFDHAGSVYVISYIEQPSLSAVVRNAEASIGALTLGFVALSITFLCVASCLLLGGWYHQRQKRSLLD